MPLTQTHKIAAAVIIVFGCGSYVAFDALRPPAYHRGQSRKSIAANVDGSDRKPTIKQNTRSKGGSRSQSKPSKSVNDFLAMRDEASRKFSGDRLFAEQRRITTLAITTLRGTDLLEFYRNLFGQGGGGIDFNWALSTGMGHVFEIGNEAEVIKWIADSDDPSLQSKLCYYAGESYYGSEFDAFLKTLSNPKSQSKFLAGHCAQLGINNLPDAINTFISLKPASVDFSDLKSVFNRTSETADFRGASDLIPPDDKSIAKDRK
jgi:hypothetical protein